MAECPGQRLHDEPTIDVNDEAAVVLAYHDRDPNQEQAAALNHEEQA